MEASAKLFVLERYVYPRGPGYGSKRAKNTVPSPLLRFKSDKRTK
jgi:hypothetical protein